MRIAFDLRRIKNPGIGRYMKCLVEAILRQEPQHDYFLILHPEAEGMIQAGNGRTRKLPCRLPTYSIREQLGLPGMLRRNQVDLLHSPHFLLPLVRPCPAVVTIHDVIYLACQQDLPSRAGRLYYRGMMAAAVRLAKRIITDSEYSKRDIVRYLRVTADKIVVVYPGVSPAFWRASEPELDTVRSRYRIEDDYILYAGIYKPRKNHGGLLRAFGQFLAHGGSAKLVIAGSLQEEGERHLRQLAGALGIANKVIFTGFVDDPQLRALYSGAHLYACPSLYEGFGFTVLEAMACGTPVVCSTETSLPEVAGEAARYADPRDPEEFGRALYEVSTNAGLRRQLAEKGRDNLRRFNWEQSAAQTFAIYREALAESGPATQA